MVPLFTRGRWGGGRYPGGWVPGIPYPHPLGYLPLLPPVLTPSGRHQKHIRLASVRYASYWNTFCYEVGGGYVFTGVCLSTRGGGHACHSHTTLLPRMPPCHAHPLSRTPHAPPRAMYVPRVLRHAVNERPVQILLECILVTFCVQSSFGGAKKQICTTVNLAPNFSLRS